MLEYQFPALGRVFHDRQTPLIADGRLLRRTMRREMITEEELEAVLRKNGISELPAVRSVCLEADGEISLIRKDAGKD